MIGILFWVIFGGLVGWIASLILGTDAQQGILANIVLGIVGAVIGGFIMRAVGYDGVTGFNLYSFIVAIIGAIVVVWVARLIW